MLNILLKTLFNVIVKFLYEDLLMPDDTYRIRTRKRAIAFIAPLAILPFGQILFKLSSMKFGTPSEIINLLVRVVIFMSVVLLWSTARYKRTVTDAMGFAFGLALNISYLFLVLTDPNTGSEGVLFAFVVGAIAFRVDAQFMSNLNMCFLPLLTTSIMAYNKSFGRPGTGHTPFVIPGAKDLAGLELFSTNVIGILMSIVALYVVNLQNKEVLRLMAASEAAVSMSRDVAGKLAAYDTAGAMTILELATDVDADLVSSLQLVTTNLNKYRDFLPEALLQPPEEDNADSVYMFDAPPLRFETELQHRKITVMRLVFPTSQALAQTDPMAAHSFSAVLLRIVARSVTDHGGLCMSLTPSNIVACWNSHKLCFNHEQNAVQCALKIAASLDGEELFERVPWTIFIAGGTGVVGTAGSDHQKSTVILGAVPHLIDLMSHLARLYPHTILITDKVHDASRATCVSRIVDVLSVDDTSTYVFEVLGAGEAIGDLIKYHEAFSALQSGHYDEASEKFLQHMRACGRPDPQALRLYRISCHLASGHSWHPRKFAGWTSFEEPSLNILVPDDVHEVTPTASPRFKEPRTSPSLQNDVGTILRNEISLSMGLRSSVIPATFTDHMRRHWRRSNKILGQGGNAQVWIGLGDNGALVALKTVVMPSGDLTAQRPANPGSQISSRSTHDVLQDVLREVSLLSNLRDENIVGYVGSAVVRGILIIIMEYVPGGSLEELLSRFTSVDVGPTQRYVRDIVRGLSFLHRSDVIHQDIKPANVLLMVDGQCKLADFGASAKLEQLRAFDNKLAGTPRYMAPEQCIGKVCKASDVWSVGVLTYQLLTGQMPYPRSVLRVDAFKLMAMIGNDETFPYETLTPQLTLPLPPMAKSFCEAILQRDPTKRPTADELLRHPFLLS